MSRWTGKINLTKYQRLSVHSRVRMRRSLILLLEMSTISYSSKLASTSSTNKESTTQEDSKSLKKINLSTKLRWSKIVFWLCKLVKWSKFMGPYLTSPCQVNWKLMGHTSTRIQLTKMNSGPCSGHAQTIKQSWTMSTSKLTNFRVKKNQSLICTRPTIPMSSILTILPIWKSNWDQSRRR